MYQLIEDGTETIWDYKPDLDAHKSAGLQRGDEKITWLYAVIHFVDESRIRDA